VVTLAVVLTEIWVFRWIVNRMPVLSDPPAWVSQDETKLPVVGYQELAKEA
jgi:hypothetical protein